jgi:hypothetical protein
LDLIFFNIALSTESDEDELSSIEVSRVFSKAEISSFAAILSSGLGKLS